MGFVHCMTCAFLLHDFLINVNRDVAVSSRRLGPKFIKKSETKKIMKKTSVSGHTEKSGRPNLSGLLLMKRKASCSARHAEIPT